MTWFRDFIRAEPEIDLAPGEISPPIALPTPSRPRKLRSIMRDGREELVQGIARREIAVNKLVAEIAEYRLALAGVDEFLDKTEGLEEERANERD